MPFELQSHDSRLQNPILIFRINAFHAPMHQTYCSYQKSRTNMWLGRLSLFILEAWLPFVQKGAHALLLVLCSKGRPKLPPAAKDIEWAHY